MAFDAARFMETAQRADREALFAALQAAMVSLVDARYGGGPVNEETLTHIGYRPWPPAMRVARGPLPAILAGQRVI